MMAQQQPADVQAPLPLCKQLAQAGRKAHTISNAAVMSKLVVLFTQRQLYARALARFWHVYAAVEAALDEASATNAGARIEPNMRTQQWQSFAVSACNA
jgi:hypothetical protein